MCCVCISRRTISSTWAETSFCARHSTCWARIIPIDRIGIKAFMRLCYALQGQPANYQRPPTNMTINRKEKRQNESLHRNQNTDQRYRSPAAGVQRGGAFGITADLWNGRVENDVGQAGGWT